MTKGMAKNNWSVKSSAEILQIICREINVANILVIKYDRYIALTPIVN